jgi:hypothetical protein
MKTTKKLVLKRLQPTANQALEPHANKPRKFFDEDPKAAYDFKRSAFLTLVIQHSKEKADLARCHAIEKHAQQCEIAKEKSKFIPAQVAYGKKNQLKLAMDPNRTQPVEDLLKLLGPTPAEITESIRGKEEVLMQLRLQHTLEKSELISRQASERSQAQAEILQLRHAMLDVRSSKDLEKSLEKNAKQSKREHIDAFKKRLRDLKNPRRIVQGIRRQVWLATQNAEMTAAALDDEQFNFFEEHRHPKEGMEHFVMRMLKHFDQLEAEAESNISEAKAGVLAPDILKVLSPLFPEVEDAEHEDTSRLVYVGGTNPMTSFQRIIKKNQTALEETPKENGEPLQLEDTETARLEDARAQRLLRIKAECEETENSQK